MTGAMGAAGFLAFFNATVCFAEATGFVGIAADDSPVPTITRTKRTQQRAQDALWS